MLTTAIYPNRIQDKQKVETELQLSEFGDFTTHFLSKLGTLLFVGYVRIVYGDHGPYVEFDRNHISNYFRPKFNRVPPPQAYYEWLVPYDGSGCKIYYQLRDVKHLKNPPPDGFKGNRTKGYADYIPGMFYVSPYDFLIMKQKLLYQSDLIPF